MALRARLVPGDLRGRLLPATLEAGCIILLLGLVVVFFSGVLQGKVLVPLDLLWNKPPWGHGKLAVANALLSDPGRIYLPWRTLLAQGRHAGALPAWDPYVLGGTPLLANSQAALFYPPNLLYGWLSVNWATTVLVLAHTAVGVTGAYALARCRPLGLRRAPAMVAGVGFAFSGFASVWAEFPTFMAVLAWMPWALLALLRLSTRPRRAPFVGLALAVAMISLGGQVQVSSYVLMGLAVVLAAEALQRVRTPLAALRTLGAGAAAIALGLMLAAPQLLATLEAGPLIIRQREALGSLLHDAFHLEQLPLLLLPRAFGDSRLGLWRAPLNENELVAFTGVVVVLLAPLCLLCVRRHQVRSVIALEAFAWAIAAGTPLFQVLYAVVPTLDQVREIARASCLHSLALPLLAAIGLDAGLRWLRANERQQWHGFGYLLGAAVVVQVLLVALVGTGAVSGLPAWLMLEEGLGLIIPVGLALLVGILLVVGGPRARVLALALPLLLFAELATAYGQYNPAQGDHGPLERPTPLTAFLASHEGRWIGYGGADYLTGNTSAALGISTVQGSDTFILTNFAETLNLAENHRGRLLVNESEPILLGSNLDSPVLDVLGVRWVVTAVRTDDMRGLASVRDLPLVDTGTDRVYERTTALPLIRAACLRRLPTEGDVLSDMDVASRPQLVSEALTSSRLGGSSADCPALSGQEPDAAPPAQVTAGKLSPDLAFAEVNAVRPVAVVMGQTHYPGWRATVDGQAAPLIKVDHSLMATVVPRGRHHVEFRFHPDVIVPGLTLSADAFMLLFAVLFPPPALILAARRRIAQRTPVAKNSPAG